MGESLCDFSCLNGPSQALCPHPSKAKNKDGQDAIKETLHFSGTFGGPGGLR